MSESAVALRYAEALCDLAREEGRGQPVLEDLARFKAALDASPGAWNRVLHPRIPTTEKESFLREHFLVGRERLVSNLVGLLLRRRREGVLPDLFRVYLEVHERREGILRVEVESASALQPPQREALQSRLAAVTGQVVVMEVREVPELLGGLRFIVGSRLFDGSLKSRLERIAHGLRSVPLEKNS